MMKLLLGGAAAAALIAIVPAFAHPAPTPPPGVAQGTTPVSPPAPHVRKQVHRMAMMPDTRADVIAHVRAMFTKLDANRDRFVTREEADATHKMMAGEMREHFAHPGMPHGDRGATFDRIDSNHDGVISRDEFAQNRLVPRTPEGPTRVMIMHDGAQGMAGMPGMMRMHTMSMRMHGKMFESADANHDGRVSLQEMTRMALQHFDRADANRDGRLTPEERMQMHHRMIEHHVQTKSA